MRKAQSIFKWLGIALILASGLIHVIDAPDSFGDAVYKGWLFYANGACALAAAIGIFRGSRILGWGLGFFVAIVSLAGYVLSRSVGLPFIPAEPDAWFEPLGVASFIAEGLFVAVFFAMRSANIKQNK